jgi:type III pantothenate kinase
MLLCIDCGNTNTVFSVWDGTQFLCTLAPRPNTNGRRTSTMSGFPR